MLDRLPPLVPLPLPEPDRRALRHRAVATVRSAVRHLSGVVVRRVLRRPRPGQAVARSLRLTFETLGATYVKLGQLVASSPGVFGDAVANEFRSCLDTGPVVPFPDVRAAVEKVLATGDQPVDDLLGDIARHGVAEAFFARDVFEHQHAADRPARRLEERRCGQVDCRRGAIRQLEIGVGVVVGGAHRGDVEPGAARQRGHQAQRDADDDGDQHGGHRELGGVPDVLADLGGDWTAAADRGAEIAAGRARHETPVLLEDRLVEVELGAHLGDLVGRGDELGEHHLHRVAGHEEQHAEDGQRHAEQHRHDGQDPPRDPGQHGPAAPGSWPSCRCCSA